MNHTLNDDTRSMSIVLKQLMMNVVLYKHLKIKFNKTYFLITTTIFYQIVFRLDTRVHIPLNRVVTDRE